MAYSTSSSLLRSVKEGNEAAWTNFYRKYSRMIQFIGEKRGLSPEECDDLMIEVMTIFWKKMDDFLYDRERGNFRSYLGRIANYCAMRFWAKKKRNESLVLQDSSMVAAYPVEIDTGIMEEWRNYILELALEELKQNMDTETWQVFYMSVVQQRQPGEISAITRKTLNNIYVIRSRYLAKLTKLIAEYRQLDEEMLGAHSHRKNLE